MTVLVKWTRGRLLIIEVIYEGLRQDDKIVTDTWRKNREKMPRTNKSL